MKQYITGGQLDEFLVSNNSIHNIDEKRLLILNKILGIDSSRNYPTFWHFTIGKMIEALGDTLKSIHYGPRCYGENQDRLEYRVYVLDKSFIEVELCDALFQALKYVLAEGQKEV